MAFTIVSQGTFTQPATAVGQYIPLPTSCDYFTTTNLTRIGVTSTPGVCIRGEWYGGGLTANNDGIRWRKGNGDSSIFIDKFSTTTASNGFTYVSSFPQPEAALTGTTITNANPAVATVTNTYSNGDQVVIFNSTGMLQIAGMTFTISSVSGSGFTLSGLDASGFGAGATSFQVRRVSPVLPVVPEYYFVTKVTQASQAVVTVSQKHNYVVGQLVEFSVPYTFGMVQLDNFYQPQNSPLMITAVTDYTFTVNVNSTNFTAFSFPASSSSPTATLFATVAPAGQRATYNPVTNVTTGYNFTDVPFRSGLFIPYMYIAPGASSPGGVAADQILWQAYKMETGTINSPVPS